MFDWLDGSLENYKRRVKTSLGRDILKSIATLTQLDTLRKIAALAHLDTQIVSYTKLLDTQTDRNTNTTGHTDIELTRLLDTQT